MMIVLMVNEIGAIDDDLGFLKEESRSISDSSVELMMYAILFEGFCATWLIFKYWVVFSAHCCIS
ncbi:hypothetical protein C5167_025135 [Papaver somniferum]|uniref:Uncharacterized protein n=1 Tax=Papaver somniferum TaxID=3469 RepID=A0A4Y7JTT9_PAPSO|nr:hypothetical protein C5167_025135 [Papaver somniferum]